MSDIDLGDGRLLKWVDLEGRFDRAVPVDHLLPDSDDFWLSLQRHCVAECCGVEAFDFTPTSILWAVGIGAEAPGENAWRSDVAPDPSALASEFSAARAAVEDLGSDVVVSSSRLNQLFDAAVFSALLAHLADTLRRAAS